LKTCEFVTIKLFLKYLPLTNLLPNIKIKKETMFDYGALPDDDLYLLLKNDDSMAYTIIYHRYFDTLYVHAANKLKDKDEAKDLVQEIFVNLWNNRTAINITTNFKSYLYVSVRNKILDRISHQQVASRYADSLQHFIITNQCVTDHLVRERQLTRIIDDQIAQLPDKMRAIFELSRRQSLSHKEIADKLNISELTVKKQVSNAVKILRSKLSVNFFLIF